MREDFETEDFCTAIFDEFFFTSITSDNFVRHLLRLLWFVHPKLSSSRLENLLKITEPDATSTAAILAVGIDPLVKMHSDLKEKVDSHLAALAATMEEDGNKTKDNII